VGELSVKLIRLETLNRSQVMKKSVYLLEMGL